MKDWFTRIDRGNSLLISNPRANVDAILFDLGNVLLFFSHELMFRQLSSVLNCDEKIVEKLLKADGLLYKLESGAVSADFFLTALTEKASDSRLSKVCIESKLRRAMSDIFSPNHSLIELLPRLKQVAKLFIVYNDYNCS